MIHEDRRRANSFGEDAQQYDRARPTYPPALVDFLLAIDSLGGSILVRYSTKLLTGVRLAA